MTGIVTLPVYPNGHQLNRNTTRVMFSELYPPYELDMTYDCGVCGERITTKITTTEVQVTTPECAYPEGIITEILLNVPSGKIIVTDDLRPVYDGFDDSEFVSYNTLRGQAQVIEAYAAAGCAYGPVGNSCPGLYKTGDDTYVIASPEYDDDIKAVLPEGWELLAGIVTDLWAYSIADYQDWLSEGGNPAELGWTATVVDIPPGSYRFTHHTGERSFDRDAEGTIIYADIEKVEND